MIRFLIVFCILLFAGELCSAVGKEIVVVRGTLTEKMLPETEGTGVKKYLKTVTDCLDRSGVEYDVIGDDDVSAGKLAGYKFAIFAYSPKMTPEEVKAIEKFVNDGGKVFFFYSIGDEIAQVLGVKILEHIKQEEAGDFAAMRFKTGAMKGLPETAIQASWNARKVEPIGHGARVIATWLDRERKDTGIPAVVVSDNGAFMSHILLDDDFLNKKRFIFAIAAHFVPGLWREAARAAIEKVGRCARFESLDDILAEANKVKASKAALGVLSQAKELRNAARELAGEGKYEEAISKAESAAELAVVGYCRMVPPRDGEIRGVWMPQEIWTTWDAAMENLKECGLNIAVPVMCSAGSANYESDILPVSDIVKERGDQLEQCLDAARKHGVQVHVWRVNWRLSRPDVDWLAKLKKEGRLQVGYDGSEVDGHGAHWLCPSDRRNRKLETDAMLEIVRKYHPDGIHFDYIRYPNQKFCYCQGCRERFQKTTGTRVTSWPGDVLAQGRFYEPFQDWRREQITALVKAVSAEARKIQPGIKISAAVFRDWETHRISVGQDWKAWCEKGYLDFVCPMDYTGDPERFRNEVTKQVTWVDGTVPLCPGIGAFSSSSRFTTPADLLYQVEIARRCGADGFVVFHYNEILATKFLPALRLSATSETEFFPLNAPKITFTIPRPAVVEMGAAFAAGEVIDVRVEVAQNVTGRVELERTTGEHLQSFDAFLAEDKRSRVVPVKVPEGLSRIAIYGSLLREDGSSVSYVKRSKPIVGLSRKAVAAIEERLGPPRVPEGTGPRVGVATDSYGGGAIFECLQQEKALRVFKVHNFSSNTLEQCDVLVLPQLKRPELLDSLSRNRIRKFVEGGGGLIVTHDAVGYRKHLPLVPEVALKGTGHPRGRKCKVMADDALTRGLAVGQEFAHSYYDHITIQAGSKGEVVVAGPDGKAVVVKGGCGKGRYVAIGMAIGLADDNQEARPSKAELRILLNAVRWAAGPTVK